MDAFCKALGARIKELREQEGLSQEALAQKLNINRIALSQIEKGDRKVSAEELAKISTAFHVPTDVLLNFKQAIQVIIEKAAAPKKKQDAGGMRISVPQKNFEKFKQALLYILTKVGSKPNVGQTVLYKLLYFIDFNFYEKYEEQLIGATYQKNHYGPTPIEFAKVIAEMEGKELATVKNRYFQLMQTKYLPLKEPNLSAFKGHELSMIDEVLEKLSAMNAAEISDYSHKDVPWLTTEDGAIIDYESVFYREAPYSVRAYRDEDLQ